MRRSESPIRLAAIAQQVEDLCLDRDVERGSWLVGDYQRGSARERHRNQRALSEAAGELVRVVTDALLGLGNADGIEQLDRLRACAFPGRAAVHAKRLFDLISDGEHGIERGHRLLEDQRDLRPRMFCISRLAERPKIGAVEDDAPFGYPAGPLHQAQDRQRRH